VAADMARRLIDERRASSGRQRPDLGALSA
jgi:hypothetical protein